MSRPLGKSALRACKKATEATDEFVEAVEKAKNRAELEALPDTGITIGRVTRSSGCNRLKVMDLDGTPDVDCRIAGAIAFKGKAATKGDRRNCMSVGDVIVIRGGLATGKLPISSCKRVKEVFDRFAARYPTGFFAAPTATAGGSDAEDDTGFEFGAAEEPEEDEELKQKALPAGRSKAAAAAVSDEEVDIDRI
jgi:hypothetical protein